MNPSPPSSVDDADLYPNQDPTVSGERGLISRLLPPAIRLWLNTQLDHIEGLEFRLGGTDRQILSGHIPQVSLRAEQAVYQGLHVSQAAVAAKGIRVNLGQVLRGKPLRLLQAFPVEGRVYLRTEDVRVSLQAPLLAQGLQDIFQQWAEAVRHPTAEDVPLASGIPWPPAHTLTDLALGTGTITLTWVLDAATNQHLRLHTHLTMAEGRYLSLCQAELQVGVAGTWSAPIPLGDRVMDLGPETNIHHLAVTPEAIEMAGLVRVTP